MNISDLYRGKYVIGLHVLSFCVYTILLVLLPLLPIFPPKSTDFIQYWDLLFILHSFLLICCAVIQAIMYHNTKDAKKLFISALIVAASGFAVIIAIFLMAVATLPKGMAF